MRGPATHQHSRHSKVVSCLLSTRIHILDIHATLTTQLQELTCKNPKLTLSQRLTVKISQPYTITNTGYITQAMTNWDDTIRAHSPCKPRHHYHNQSRVRPFPSGSAQAIVAWEQVSPAHQALKAAPVSSCLNPPLSVKRSSTCLKSILPRPPQQSCPATELISVVAGLVFSSITRAP